MKKAYRYFAYSHETGFDTYETADDAKKAAEESLQAYRDVADDGWDEEVTGCCWGEIKQETVELPTGELINDYGDYVAEYELRDVGATDTKEYSDEQIDAIFGDSPFVARETLDKTSYEVVQRENADWRELITNDAPKHHGYFDSYDEAEKAQRRLHTRWVLSGA